MVAGRCVEYDGWARTGCALAMAELERRWWDWIDNVGRAATGDEEIDCGGELVGKKGRNRKGRKGAVEGHGFAGRFGDGVIGIWLWW
ncbi:hypothetical protein M0R45_019571 [Rubus argutus]|uniref:Uncharacterized protein n=1 Tax=Rubus argutus TaxID=59490 RepID=A0AAW1X7K2_RUBAR